jgi:hypothetical protein
MKRETFETAQLLDLQLTDVNSAIDKVNSDGLSEVVKYFSTDESKLLKQYTLRYLNNRKKSLEKEFENLK